MGLNTAVYEGVNYKNAATAAYQVYGAAKNVLDFLDETVDDSIVTAARANVESAWNVYNALRQIADGF